MESNQDSATLVQQIQVLAATVEELTRKNQEMRLRLQLEESQSKGSPEDEGDSRRRSDQTRPLSPEDRNLDLLREMRKEMDEHQREDRTGCGQAGQSNRFTFHHGGPGMSSTVKVLVTSVGTV